MKDPLNDEFLAAAVVERLAQARRELLERMKDAGLRTEDGWRITEELRHVVGGTVWVFKPVHLREPAAALEVRVEIDSSGRVIEPSRESGT
ncbi:MAG TPA: hypothetical protein VLC53_14600 [Myxococcota bacterium]|nr:hypothetical protein [Myxococcota bacterium]